METQLTGARWLLEPSPAPMGHSWELLSTEQGPTPCCGDRAQGRSLSRCGAGPVAPSTCILSLLPHGTVTPRAFCFPVSMHGVAKAQRLQQRLPAPVLS